MLSSYGPPPQKGGARTAALTVRHGRRFVRIFSPLSLLAIGLVASSGALASLFFGRFFPEDLVSREFARAATGFGAYLLSIGVPCLAAFATRVVETPREHDERGIGFDTLLGFYIAATSTAGFLGLGGWLAYALPDYFPIGVALLLIGLLDTFVILPLFLFLRAERKDE